MGSISMRKLCLLLLVAGTAFLVGCQKKNKKTTKVAQSSVEVKGNKSIPVYPVENDEFFDDKAVNDYAFVDEGKNKKNDDSEKPVAAAVTHSDDWDDEKVSLAWEDEEKNSGFKVINFDFDKNNIRKDQVTKVEQDAKLAENVVKSGKEVVITGHACPIGSDSYNMSLSERRALAVKNEMEKRGVAGNKIKILGCGSQKPIVLSDAESREERIRELAPNRRAQVAVN
jgi:outer membrane protein OmpA-like peptidoglycan-associated protein